MLSHQQINQESSAAAAATITYKQAKAEKKVTRKKGKLVKVSQYAAVVTSESKRDQAKLQE